MEESEESANIADNVNNEAGQQNIPWSGPHLNEEYFFMLTNLVLLKPLFVVYIFIWFEVGVVRFK